MRKVLRNKAVYATALAALVAGLALLVVRPAVAATPIKIMPLGDSITGSPGCWRALLWNQLQSGGYTNIDFVGTLPPQGCGVAYDGDNEGHGGYLATNIANQSMLPGWLSATNPDIVMMHLGTNDVWSNIAPATILAAFSTLVDQMRANNPNVKVLVAQIIPMNPSSCPECAQRTVTFNAAIPAWVSSKSTTQSPIKVVDQWTGFNTATDTGDGVHPNDSGNQKMAAKWYPALTPWLGTSPTTAPTTARTTAPTTARTTAPTTARTTAPTTARTTAATTARTTAATTGPTGPAGACTATYKLVNSWPGGFQAQVDVTASGSINGWTVKLTLPSGVTISSLWNGVNTGTSGAVSVKNASYNAGAPTNFGFVANGSSSTAPGGISCTSP